MLLATLGLLLQMAAPKAQAPDEERVVRGARSAQQQFERTRRAGLPRTLGYGTSRRCDAQIGRYCYWYDSTDTAAEPEPQRIVEARLKLLSALDSAAAAAPGNSWIVGQRVRYHLEAGRHAEAILAAQACGAEPWWCSALAGLAHHVSMRYASADSAFDVALARMPPEQRCDWLDISMAVAGEWQRAIRRASCAERAALVHGLFTMSQPLWMHAGNDLRTEFLARQTMALVFERSANAHGMRFGPDSRELLLRYGWAEWFTREESSVTGYQTYAVTGHDREPSYYFFPDAPPTGSWHLAPDVWRLRESTAPTRYAPRHIKKLTALPHQLARFSRGDSVLLVAAFTLPDAPLARDRLVTAIAIHQRGRVSVLGRDSSRILAALAPNAPLVVSIEAHGERSNHAARARYSIDALSCSAWCLSDLLIVNPAATTENAEPARAAEAAYAATELRRDDAVGVYFEIRRAASMPAATPPAAATFTLSVTPVQVSFARRLAATLRLAERPEAMRLRWQATVGVGESDAELVRLHLPESARGRYRVQLTVRPNGSAPVTAVRELEIR